MSILNSRAVAVVLAVAIVIAPISPMLYAQTATTTEETTSRVDRTRTAGADTATNTSGDTSSSGSDSTNSSQAGEGDSAVSGGSGSSDQNDTSSSSSSPDMSESTTLSAQSNEPSGSSEVGTAATDVGDPAASTTASTSSGAVDPAESDTDNTNFENVGSAEPTDPNKPIVDVSATTTESAALEPVFARDADVEGTGGKIGGTIFTGDAIASTTIKNTLNITRANVDGPGKTNSSHIRAETTNEAELTTDGSANAGTGENTALGGEGTATLVTGKARASADVINVVNTNLFNSEGFVLFLDSARGARADLRNFDLSYFFDEGPGASPTENGCTILTCLNSSDLEVLNTNTATVTNKVSVHAISGANIASSTVQGNAFVRTGDAYAAANVMNLVNTNFIDSSYFVTSYTNYGDLESDIVLPEKAFFEQLLANGNSLPMLNSSSFVVDNTNDENFFGTTTARAITGGNVATSTGAGHGEIFTGLAQSSANSYTAANQTRVGGSSVHFIIRVWGNWSGSIKNLPRGLVARQTENGIEIFSDGRSGVPTGTIGVYNSSQFVASSTNMANVQTDVEVEAKTGENALEVQDGIGSITSGNAFATANVINMVNTNVVNRNWVFGIFNVFGDFQGDISFGGLDPDLSVVASANVTSAEPNADVLYEFVVKNNGEGVASNSTLNLTYDRNVLGLAQVTSGALETSTGIKWNLGTLAAGESRIFNATGRVLVTDLLPGVTVPIVMAAGVSSTDHDTNSSNNASSATVDVSDPNAGNSETNEPPAPPPQSPPPPPPPPPSGGGGGGGDPSPSPAPTPPSPPPTSGGGGGSPPPPSPSPASSPGGGGGSPSTSSGSSSGGGGGGGGGGLFTSGAGPVVFVSATSTPGVSKSDPNVDPKISVRKTASLSASTTPAKIFIDYKVVIGNDKWARPAYFSTLTDTLYDTGNRPMYNRSWPLGTLEPGDQLTLTYTVEFDANKTKPGIYRNVGKVTGYRNQIQSGPQASPIPAAEGWGDVTFAQGQVLGASAAVPQAAPPPAPAACVPLLSGYLRRGSTNAAEVKRLQIFLNVEVAANLPTSGLYGPMTASAVSKFQEKYSSEILVPAGLSRGTGSVYASTLKKINAISCSLLGQTTTSPSTGSTSSPQAGSGQAAPVTEQDVTPPAEVSVVSAVPASAPAPAAAQKPKQKTTQKTETSDARGAGRFSVTPQATSNSGGWLSNLFKKSN